MYVSESSRPSRHNVNSEESMFLKVEGLKAAYIPG